MRVSVPECLTGKRENQRPTSPAGTFLVQTPILQIAKLRLSSGKPGAGGGGCGMQISVQQQIFFHIQRCDRVTGKVYISHHWGLFDPRLDASWKGHAEHTEASSGALDQRTFRVHSTLRHQFSPMTLCNRMDRSPPGSSVVRILQTRILE